MDKKKIIYIVVLALILIVAVVLVTIFIPLEGKQYEGTRKAIIVCSANDFYGSTPEDEFDGKNDATFEINEGNWTFMPNFNCIGGHDPIFFNITPGSLFIRPVVEGNASGKFLLAYSDNYPLYEYVFYNFTVSVYIDGAGINGTGARIGLQWLNSTGYIVRTDWSTNINMTGSNWKSISVMGVCNNETGNEISKLMLILSVEGAFAGGPPGSLYYDDVIIDKWIQVNLTDPTDPDPPPPPPGINSDGFPAQALQVYWVLKNHGYCDEDIFLMLYYKDDADGVIDIYRFDVYPNDLIHGTEQAVIDVANENVTSTRFKQELNVSFSGSFASGIKPEDQLIIYMVNHGSNAILGDGNATFHFEADNFWITEFEFYDLVKEIDCIRMLICVDCCFSGNFLNADKNVGSSWYDIPNCIFVSASSNNLAWYWINNLNLDTWAGSWFFHPFWEQLDQNATIAAAYNFAITFIPITNPPLPPVQFIQNPLMHDNLGINDTWSFISDPSL